MTHTNLFSRRLRSATALCVAGAVAFGISACGDASSEELTDAVKPVVDQAVPGLTTTCPSVELKDGTKATCTVKNEAGDSVELPVNIKETDDAFVPEIDTSALAPLVEGGATEEEGAVEEEEAP